MITGTQNGYKAIEFYAQAKTMFESASMNLREWITDGELVNMSISYKDKSIIKVHVIRIVEFHSRHNFVKTNTRNDNRNSNKAVCTHHEEVYIMRQ